MSDRIRTAETDGVVTITMDDPERMNPLSREDYLGIYDALRAARTTDATCVVLEGAGEAFSAGFDVESMGEGAGGDEPLHENVGEIRRHEHSVVQEIITHPLPVIGKIDGPAVGDAAGFAIACDIPLASERTKIGFSHVRFGLSMDCGISYVLPRLVGRGLAMELAMTGRIVDGERANELGLVNHVFPTDEFETRADEIVETIASGPPIALEHIKYLIRTGQTASLEAALENEAARQTIVFDTEDYEHAVEALQNDEKPTFEGR
ncbi:enoyl-CoA hydratase [Salinadaptatus halalkaliphilus]|uniref:Enoyl-CoA hydratase n=1 Tax=Salinadaptatus halalkaliphilus TaxID=2419781 RepID=A0A4S3TPR4_9EURY|nr:enoyl-CoA hydratase-related protein [Salinadaptatus halalkaliphilus]THE66332.1 enoyl-CoA hydratase [Salinadaptatus halalkaliphilus]